VKLPGLGISRRFLRKYMHAPQECYGMHILSLYTLQWAPHVEILVKHWKEQSVTGQLMRSIMECLQLEIGLPGHPLDYNYES